MHTMVYGNLALSEREETQEFTVVDGGAEHLTVACPVQIFAPDIYAKPAASQTRFSASSLAAGMMAIAICAVIVTSVFAFRNASVRRAAIDEAARIEIRVQPGESLWSLAEAYPIDGLSTAETVEAIKDWNDLSLSTLDAGESLIVPRGVSHQ